MTGRATALVTRADDDLGVILAAAKAHLGPRTLFLMTSDHGAQWPFGKWNCYEAGVQVPLIVAWPGQVRPGSRSDAMVSWVDLLPTLVELAGGRPPAGIDGRSFAAVLRGTATTHRDRIFTTHSGDGDWNVYPIRAVRAGEWKYIRNLHPEFAFTTHIDLQGNLGQRAYFRTWEDAASRSPAAAALVKRYHGRPAEELYDLSRDPEEQHNLAGDPGQAARLASLRAEVDRWMQDQGDVGRVFGRPRLLSNPDSYGPKGPPGNAGTKAGGKKKAP